MGFELPNGGTPSKDDDFEGFPLTPPSSKKPLSSGLTVADRNHISQSFADDPQAEVKEMRRRLADTERALKRSNIDNHKLKNQVREKIRSKHDDAVEKKRQRDEAHVTERRQSHELIAQLRDEKAKNEELHVELEKAESKSTKYKNVADRVKYEKEDIVRSNKELQEKLKESEEQLRSMNERHDVQSQKHAEFTDEIQAKSREIAEMNSRLQTLGEEVNVANERAHRSESIQKSLAAELTEARMGHVKAKELETRLQSTKTLLNERTNQATGLTERLAKTSADSVQHQKRVEELHIELQAQEKQVAQLKAEKGAIQHELAEEAKESNELRTEIGQLLQEGSTKDEAIQEHHRTIAALQNEKEAYSAEADLARDQANVNEVDIVKVKRALESTQSALRETNDKLGKEQAANQVNSRELTYFKEESQTLKQALSTYETEANRFREDVAVLSMKLDERNATIQEQRSQLEGTHSELGDIRARRSIANHNLEEETKLKKQLEVDCASLQQQLDVKSELVEKHGAKNATLTEDLLKSRLSLYEKESELSTASHRLELHANEITVKTQEIRELREELQQCREEITSKSAQIVAIEGDVLHQSARYEEMQRNKEALQEQLRDAENVRDSLRGALAESERVNADISKRFNENEQTQRVEEQKRKEMQDKHNVAISAINNALTASESRCTILAEQNAALQHDVERYARDTQRNEQRATVLEGEIKNLEGVSEEMETLKEKHLNELIELQNAVEDHEAKQTNYARQIHRLMKELREANAETMDVIQWRDEERGAHSELKRAYADLEKGTTEKILALQHDLSESRFAAESAARQIQECMRETSALGKSVQQRDEEICGQHLALGSCREELIYERSEHASLQAKHEGLQAEIGENRQLLSLMHNEVTSLKNSNQALSEKLRASEDEALGVQKHSEKLERTITAMREDAHDTAFAKESLSKDYDMLRSKYQSLKEHERRTREELGAKEAALERLNTALQAEQSNSSRLKAHHEHVVHELHEKHNEDKKTITKLSDTTKTLRVEQSTGSEKISSLEQAVRDTAAVSEASIAKAREERDTHIKKYFSACNRNNQLERECQEARKNYINEYESFEKLKMNHERELDLIREQITKREDKFRGAIAKEKQRADIAEGKLNK